MRRQLHPEFREAFCTSKVKARDLAAAAGMPRATLGRIMATPGDIRVTPLVERRLQRLANILWFPSDRIFR
jgi:hypothetical protein